MNEGTTSAPEREAASDVRARVGEQEFERLYGRNAAPLLRYLSRVTGDRSLAEDLLQKTFFKLLETPVPAMDDRSMRNYLFRMATNLIADHHRGKKREGLFTFFRRDTPATVERRDLQNDVRKVFGNLKEKDRSLLWLAYVEGCTHDEIAQISGVSSGSVKVLLFRARRRLAGLLTDNGLFAEPWS